MNHIKIVWIESEDPPGIPDTPPLPDIPDTPPLPTPPDTPQPGG